ncbi:MAG: response regulator transcription factor [Eggerthellaceae bacterium]
MQAGAIGLQRSSSLKHNSENHPVGDDRKREIGHLNLLSLGFGLHLSWCYITMYGSTTVFGLEPASLEEGFEGFSCFFLVSLAVFAVALIALGLCAKQVRGRLICRKGAVAACSLMVLGTLLATAAGMIGEPDASVVLSTAEGIVTGLGSASMFLFWGTAFSMAEFTTAILNLAAAFVVSISLYAAFSFAALPASGLLASVLPLLDLLVLLHLRPSFFLGESPLPVLESLPIRTGSFAVHVVTPVAFFGLALGLLNVAAFMDVIEIEKMGEALCLAIAAVVAFVVVAAVQMLFITKHNISTFFKHMLPFIALCTCMASLDVLDQSGVLCNMAVLVAFLSLNILMLSLFCDLSQSYRLNPLYIFGVGRGSMALAMLLGTFLAIEGEHVLPSLMRGGSLTALVLLSMLLGLCTLPSRPTIEKASRNARSMTFYYQKQDRETPSLLGSEAQLGIATRAPGARRPGASTAALSKGMMRHSTGTLEDPIPPEELLQAQCEAVANCYLLSQRETEVFYYLAKGFNSAAIQQHLVISKGTAKTHIRHIYRKLNIHSQQELIDLVDATLEGGL